MNARLSMGTGLVILTTSIASAASPLTLEQRVAAATAVEKVYWEHRIWPSDNPGPRPPFPTATLAGVIRERVEDSLRESDALAKLWSHPITSADLQSELNRMVTGSKDPALLRELVAALGDDPRLASETIARPALADRLIRRWYAADERFQGDVRRAARRAVEGSTEPEDLKLAGGEYSERTVAASESEWADLAALPVGSVGALVEGESSILSRTVLARDADQIRVATLRWPKASFEEWWLAQRTKFTLEPAFETGTISLPISLSSLSSGCVDDTWTRISTPPDPLSQHFSFWTGTEMIVWEQATGTGGRYDPATDSWRPVRFAGAPVGRSYATAVWAGSRMIVWGGRAGTGDQSVLNTGASYDPIADTWTPTTTMNAPSARNGHIAVGAGSRMIVWGGGGGITGGVYDPATDSWDTTETVNAPSYRTDPSVVWTGSEMIVWGGSFTSGSLLNTGSRYNPTMRTWTAMTTSNAPSARHGALAVWSGSEMIVWGGAGNSVLFDTGGRYNPVTDQWTATSLTGAPSARNGAKGFWSGSEMIFWGGGAYNGGRYNPLSDTWAPVNSPSFSIGQSDHTVVWTGSEMIVWGGTLFVPMNAGGRFNPSTSTWVPTGPPGAPVARYNPSAVWTGVEMIIWGGKENELFNTGFINTGARYIPATDSWSSTTNSGAPEPRENHAAVWTGRRMFVWGGYGSPTLHGGEYDPATNTWVPVSDAGAPPVYVSCCSNPPNTKLDWTGKEVLVWGRFLANSGRYDPGAQVWHALPTSGAPSERWFIDPVWTGQYWLIWGGVSATDGFRYDPVADGWSPMSITGAPAAHQGYTAVWTGSKMLVWGSPDLSQDNDGGQYDPGTNSWIPITPTGAPSRRTAHTATWSGTEMLVWGGNGPAASVLDTGGRYNPATNSWTPTSVSELMRPHYHHFAFWVGDRMLVWGGQFTYSYGRSSMGGLYCRPCASPHLFYRDADVDGHGVPGQTAESCDPVPVAGWSSILGDCDDSDPAVYAGAPQICDGQNNDCSDPSYPALPGPEVDNDADGIDECHGDCNDGNAAVRPGATETCNAIDDDCDGLIDEDAAGVDTDGDGLRNLCDNCVGAFNPDQRDNDGDHLGNACDNCASTPNPNQLDTDSDQRGNACDNCPLSYNPFQDDADQDNVGDVCDNCLVDPNGGQSDGDHDGEGDVCDLDDGLILEMRADKSTIVWQEEQGPSSWNVYVGDFDLVKSSGAYTQEPGSNPFAARYCGETDFAVTDTGTPATGKIVFSLVTGVTGGVEGSLGTRTGGIERPNDNPCP